MKFQQSFSKMIDAHQSVKARTVKLCLQ